MSKVAVVFWSGTGNTQAMADAVAEGAKGAGADVSVFGPCLIYALLESCTSAEKESCLLIDKLNLSEKASNKNDYGGGDCIGEQEKNGSPHLGEGCIDIRGDRGTQ